MKQITIEWINEKVGALYLANQELQEQLKIVSIENADLKNKLADKDKEPEGSIVDAG